MLCNHSLEGEEWKEQASYMKWCEEDPKQKARCEQIFFSGQKAPLKPHYVI